MALPAAFGNVVYNEIDLSGHWISSTLSIVTEPDPTGRGAMFDRMTFSFSGYLAVDDDTGRGIFTGGSGYADLDDAVNAIRERLSEYGKQFEYDGRGLGSFAVNDGNGLDDVDFGPKPGPLLLKPVGAEKMIEFEWSLEVCIPRCSTGGANILGTIIGWSYEVQWSITDGYMTRTITGFARIATALDDQGKALHTADDIRSELVPDIPGDEFRRDFQWSLNNRKDVISYVVTDVELTGDNGLPVGVRKADVTFSTITNTGMQQSGSENVLTRACRISGTISVAKPYPIVTGWERMLIIIVERMQKAREKQNYPILYSINVTESLFGRDVSFSVEYVVLLQGNRTPASIVRGTITDVGLFQPISGNTHRAWQQSMQHGPHHERGNLRLTHVRESDQVIDPCNSSRRVPGTVRDTFGSGANTIGAGGLLSADCPPKDNSYILYRNHVGYSAIGGAIASVEIPIKSPFRGLPASVVKAGEDVIAHLPGAAEGLAATDTILTAVQLAVTRVVLTGMAARICHTPEPPNVSGELIEYLDMVVDSSKFVRGKVTSFGAHDVYGLRWRVVYRLRKPLDEKFVQLVKELKPGI